jgi:hypothetical protein
VQERRLASGADEDEDFFGEVEGERRRQRPDRPPDPREEKRRKRRGMLEDLFDF